MKSQSGDALSGLSGGWLLLLPSSPLPDKGHRPTLGLVDNLLPPQYRLFCCKLINAILR